MNTPIEKASAVRSGGSSMASRRRKVERNIYLTGFETRRAIFVLKAALEIGVQPLLSLDAQ